MLIRQPAVRGQFYPDSEKECLDMTEIFMREAASSVEKNRGMTGGIAPHAGWVFSGATAAKLFASVPETPDVFVFAGAVHRYGVAKPSLFSQGQWVTPLGNLSVDEELAKEVLESLDGRIVENPAAHEGEHSIEVLLPFVAALFPGAKILPIAWPPVGNSYEIGLALAETLKKSGKKFQVIASTDLTHYGPGYGFMPAGSGPEAKRWVKEVNDGKLLELILYLKGEEIIPYVRESQSACGAGGVTAAVAQAKAAGVTEGTLLEYITSSDRMPPRYRSENFVCYAGVCFSV